MIFLKSSEKVWMYVHVSSLFHCCCCQEPTPPWKKNITSIISSKLKHSFSKIGKEIIFLFVICTYRLNFVYVTCVKYSHHPWRTVIFPVSVQIDLTGQTEKDIARDALKG